MEKKMNILYITSDQQHFNTIGKFNPEIKTPNLDRLCNSGTYFDHAYTVNPTCTATRASLITGKYPSQHGAWTLGTKLPETETTIGALMQQEGMRTAIVGKAHFQPLSTTKEYPSLEAYPILQDLEFWKQFQDDFYGFDTVRLAKNHTTEAHVGQHYANWMERKGCDNWRDYFEAPTGRLNSTQRWLWDIPEEYHYDTWIAEETNQLLQEFKDKDEQFFLWSSFLDPHPSYFVPKEWIDMYDPNELTLPRVTPGEHDDSPVEIQMTQTENPDFSAYRLSGYALHGMHTHLRHTEEVMRKNMSVYYAMISMMDKYIGKILDKLDELGLTENTLIVFTTDHGHFFGQHGLIAKGPFMYEDAIKVPMIVSLPGVVPENTVNHSLQSLVDIPVTCMNYSGVSVPYNMTGVDEREVWEGKKEKARDHIICEHHHERHTVNLRAYVDERYKLVVWQDHTYGQLYDLQEDPGEIHNHWDDPEYVETKVMLLMKYISAELKKESLYMPRIDLA